MIANLYIFKHSRTHKVQHLLWNAFCQPGVCKCQAKEGQSANWGMGGGINHFKYIFIFSIFMCFRIDNQRALGWLVLLSACPVELLVSTLSAFLSWDNGLICHDFEASVYQLGLTVKFMKSFYLLQQGLETNHHEGTDYGPDLIISRTQAATWSWRNACMHDAGHSSHTLLPCEPRGLLRFTVDGGHAFSACPLFCVCLECIWSSLMTGEAGKLSSLLCFVLTEIRWSDCKLWTVVLCQEERFLLASLCEGKQLWERKDGKNVNPLAPQAKRSRNKTAGLSVVSDKTTKHPEALH